MLKSTIIQTSFLRVSRNPLVNDGGDSVSFGLQLPFELGFLSKADVSWSYYNDYTNLYSYCWWKCNYSLNIVSLRLIEVSDTYVDPFIDPFILSLISGKVSDSFMECRNVLYYRSQMI